MKTIFVFFVIVLFLIHPGCMVRYGEGKLNHMLHSIKDLEGVYKENKGGKVTEEQVKERLGKPGWLKPVYETEHKLPLCDKYDILCKLKRDSNVLLNHYPCDLYDVLLGNKEGELKSLKLLSYVYDRMGKEEASLTFYVGSFEGPQDDAPHVIGWDYVKYGNGDSGNIKKEEGGLVNCRIDKPVDCIRRPYAFLIDTIIGLKQFVGEIAKSPVSFVEAEFLENIFIEKKIPFYKFDGFKAAIEDWRNGFTALTYRHKVDGKQGVLRTTQNLLGEIPVIGPVFDQWYKKESAIANAADKYFLTRGIYGGDNTAQNTALWVHDVSGKKKANGFCVKAIPYRYGSVVDVLWSLLNISHGYAYDMASEIVFNNNVNPGDSICLSGHSGGVQRIISTSRILHDDGINVEKMYGIAGLALGHAPCSEVDVVLNGKIMDDPISYVSRLLNYLTFNLLTNIEWEYKSDVDKRHKHMTPGFVDGRTRLKYDGFLVP